MQQKESSWLGWDEAKAKLLEVQNASDELTSRLVGKAFAGLVPKLVQGPPPNGRDVDLEFVVDILIEFCKQHDSIRYLMSGGDYNWFDSKEDEEAFWTRMER